DHLGPAVVTVEADLGDHDADGVGRARRRCVRRTTRQHYSLDTGLWTPDQERRCASRTGGSALRERDGLWLGGSAGHARQREPERAAALAERVAVEPEQARRAQLVAARRGEQVRQQRPLQQRERVAV